MGLNIYFRKIACTKNEKQKLRNKIKKQKALGNPNADKLVKIDIGFFKKATFLMTRFNPEYENGVEIPITTAQLRQLLADCKKVYRNHKLVRELLPTFDYTDKDYNEEYFQKIDEVKKWVALFIKTAKDTDKYYFLSIF